MNEFRQKMLEVVQEVDQEELERSFISSLKIMLVLILVAPAAYLIAGGTLLTAVAMYAAVAITALVVRVGTSGNWANLAPTSRRVRSNDWFFEKFD